MSNPATAAVTKKQALDLVVYDAEIIKGVPNPREKRLDDIEYCEGWHDHANMGLSVLGAIDLREGRPRVFLEDNLDEFRELIHERNVIGFNNAAFDNALLKAHGIEIDPARCFDLLIMMRRAVGEPDVYTKGVTAAGRSLDAIARANLGVSKSGKGDLAPVLWQRGKRGAVIDYCLNDVAITARLVRRLPTLIDPVTGKTVDMPMVR